jgi:fructose-1,6-bisphosphatase I
VVQHTATSVVTIERFIIEQERLHPEATGELSGILYDLALAAKMIANKVRCAGLADILGATHDSNVQGEIQQKLDVFANDTIVNVPVGTVFSIVQKITRGRHGEMEDMLQPGRRQVAAGYVIYGSSTMLVYTTGQGVHGFTLDPSIGEFLLSHPNIRTPDEGQFLSVNDSYEQHWDEPTKQLMRRYRGLEGNRHPLTVRYVGSLVADFHRNLLGGGVFCYPPSRKSPTGKLRLLYEANPLAFICEQAGGAAIDGKIRVLDVQPTELHQRIPLFIGSKNDVDLATQIFAHHSELVGA